MSDSIPPTAAPQFSVSVRGYDRLQVETYVEQLQQRLEEARERLDKAEEAHSQTADKLHRRVGELEDQLTAAQRNQLQSTEPSFLALGDHIGQMLELAKTEARAMRERASREAEEVVTRARRDAERLTNEQQERREQLERQLRALHDNLSAVLDVAPPVVAAAATAEPAAASPGDRAAAQPPSPDALDDETQVVQVVRGGGR